jgi:hypothetical protein
MYQAIIELNEKEYLFLNEYCISMRAKRNVKNIYLIDLKE